MEMMNGNDKRVLATGLDKLSWQLEGHIWLTTSGVAHHVQCAMCNVHSEKGDVPRSSNLFRPSFRLSTFYVNGAEITEFKLNRSVMVIGIELRVQGIQLCHKL